MGKTLIIKKNINSKLFFINKLTYLHKKNFLEINCLNQLYYIKENHLYNKNSEKGIQDSKVNEKSCFLFFFSKNKFFSYKMYLFIENYKLIIFFNSI